MVLRLIKAALIAGLAALVIRSLPDIRRCQILARDVEVGGVHGAHGERA